jgi:hypothetical protein
MSVKTPIWTEFSCACTWAIAAKPTAAAHAACRNNPIISFLLCRWLNSKINMQLVDVRT